MGEKERNMGEARDRLLRDIHNESEAYYSVEHSGIGVSFYEYLATRLISLGYVKLPPDCAILEGISNLANIGDSQFE